MMYNERMPKKMTGRMEGIRKRGRPRRRCTDEVLENLKIMGIRNWYSVVRDGEGRTRDVLEPTALLQKEDERTQVVEMDICQCYIVAPHITHIGSSVHCTDA
jgi:hypothetical protein